MASNSAFMRGEVDGFGNVDGLPTQKKNVIPRFFVNPVRISDGDKGYKFQDVEMVELLIAGDAKSAPVEKVTERHKEVYSDQYDAFIRGKEVSVEGTPLDNWPVMAGKPALVQALKFAHIHTVEALSDIPDNAVQKLGPGTTELRVLARAFVEAKKSSDPVERLTKENSILKADIQNMKKQLDMIQKGRDASKNPRPVKVPPK